MLYPWRRALLAALMIGGLVSLGSSAGSTSTAAKPAKPFSVKDEAEFFKDSAIENANRIVKEIKDRYHRDLLIHTLPSVPAADRDRVEKMDLDARKQYFLDLAKREAKNAKVDGVFILICKRPKGFFNVAVEVGDRTTTYFGAGEQRKLRDELVKDFNAKKYDSGLVRAAEHVRDTLKANPPPKP